MTDEEQQLADDDSYSAWSHQYELDTRRYREENELDSHSGTSVTEVDVMNIDSAFPSKYIKNADLQGRKLKMAIEGVRMEEVSKTDTKPVLYFVGKEKGLVINKTKAGILSGAFGKDTDGWIGKEVAIFPTRVVFGDQMVDSIGLEPFMPIVEDFTDDSVPF